jgi:hypothetical protein
MTIDRNYLLARRMLGEALMMLLRQDDDERAPKALAELQRQCDEIDERLKAMGDELEVTVVEDTETGPRDVSVRMKPVTLRAQLPRIN